MESADTAAIQFVAYRTVFKVPTQIQKNGAFIILIIASMLQLN